MKRGDLITLLGGAALLPVAGQGWQPMPVVDPIVAGLVASLNRPQGTLLGERQ
jgi:hypothetical protein